MESFQNVIGHVRNTFSYKELRLSFEYAFDIIKLEILNVVIEDA